MQVLPPTGPLNVNANPYDHRHRAPVFKCPSDQTSVQTSVIVNRKNNYMFNMGDKYFSSDGTRHADFKANPPITTRARGPFACIISLRLKDITDGTSKTIVMAETIVTREGIDLSSQGFTKNGAIWPANDRAAVVNNDAHSPSGCWARWNGSGFSSGQLYEPARCPGAVWLFGRPNLVAFNTVMPPNGPTCSFGTDYGIHTARSYYPGGVAVVMLDAAVRFVSEAIDSGTRTTEKTHTHSGESPYGVWGALGTRASSEQFSGDF